MVTRRDSHRETARRAPGPSPALVRRRARVRLLRRIIVRVVAIGACLIALVGIVGSVIAFRQISGAQRAAQAELRQISDNFAQIATTLDTVSASAANASSSVGEARGALDNTVRTTRDIANTLDETARTINFTVPGTTYKPLEGVDTSFRNQARQLRTVAGDVERTNTALGQNGTDLKSISGEVATVARQMRDISTQLRQLSSEGGGSLTTITDGTRLLVIWSGILHLLILALGISLYLLTVEEHALANEREPGGGRADVGDDIIEW